jgi:hypothetical protein
VQEIAAVRQEIIGLLREQMEALDSPGGMTDELLRECYRRQERVQELRERLQCWSVSEGGTGSAHAELSSSTETASCEAQPLVSSETAVRI